MVAGKLDQERETFTIERSIGRDVRPEQVPALLATLQDWFVLEPFRFVFTPSSKLSSWCFFFSQQAKAVQCACGACRRSCAGGQCPSGCRHHCDVRHPRRCCQLSFLFPSHHNSLQFLFVVVSFFFTTQRKQQEKKRHLCG